MNSERTLEISVSTEHIYNELEHMFRRYGFLKEGEQIEEISLPPLPLKMGGATGMVALKIKQEQEVTVN